MLYTTSVRNSKILGIMAGTGFEVLFDCQSPATRLLTSCGRVDYFRSSLAGLDLIIVPRHGTDHSFPPHRIPSKAQLIGLVQLGAEKIIAMSAVGSADHNYRI